MYLLSLLYKLLTTLRNRLYDKNYLKIRKVDGVEVVCVGNITVGGTGKTPAVQYLAKKYMAEGKKPAIVSRGYKGEREEDPLLVRDRENIQVEARNCGDEAYLHALELDIPIVVGRDRYEACRKVIDNYDVDVIILDDGFQHRKLHRDRNIILIDATNPFGGRKLLPAGTLRESLDGLRRADEFIITKSDMVGKERVEEIKRELLEYGKRVSVAKHGPVKLYNDNEELRLESIKGKTVLAFSALANPWQFVKTIEQFEPKEIKNIGFKDHYYYKEEDFDRITREAEGFDLILSTEKDRVKFHKRYKNSKLYTLKIEFEILEN